MFVYAEKAKNYRTTTSLKSKTLFNNTTLRLKAQQLKSR